MNRHLDWPHLWSTQSSRRLRKSEVRARLSCSSNKTPTRRCTIPIAPTCLKPDQSPWKAFQRILPTTQESKRPTSASRLRNRLSIEFQPNQQHGVDKVGLVLMRLILARPQLAGNILIASR